MLEVESEHKNPPEVLWVHFLYLADTIITSNLHLKTEQISINSSKTKSDRILKNILVP